MIRAGLRIAGILLLFLVCVVPHLLARALLGRSPVPPFFLGGVAWIAGARVRTLGEPVRPHTLLLANHLSWLDILVLAGATGCAFVSKDSLGHPLVHWLADQNNTLYVRRENRRGAAEQANAIVAALARPQPLALFPEGTTGDGRGLLAFKPALLAAVAPLPEGVEVRPVAIHYAPAVEIAWYGEKALENVMRVLGRRGTVPITIHLLSPLEPSDDRKRLAQQARDAIAASLAASSPPRNGL